MKIRETRKRFSTLHLAPYHNNYIFTYSVCYNAPILNKLYRSIYTTYIKLVNLIPLLNKDSNKDATVRLTGFYILLGIYF